MESEARSLQEITITEILRSLGVPAHICGYKFLREAILFYIYNPDINRMITKTLYPAVAEHFGTTPQKVERGIRHAIELAWGYGTIELMKTDTRSPVFGLQGKPTNAQLIAILADWVRLHPGDG